MDERLDMYEDLCGPCMELKSKVAAGEQVSREEAQSLIDRFLNMNKALKSHESEMSAAQQRRFASIGEWFTTGVRPEKSKRGDVFLLASLSAPNMAYGLMAGYQHRRWGGYLAFRSSFTSCKTSYSCTSDGNLGNGSQIWPSGNE